MFDNDSGFNDYSNYDSYDSQYDYNYSDYGSGSEYYNYNYSGNSGYPNFDSSYNNGGSGSFPGFDPSFNFSNINMTMSPCDYYPYNRDPNIPINAMIYQMMNSFSNMTNNTTPPPQSFNNTAQPGTGGSISGPGGNFSLPSLDFINIPC